MSEETHQPAPRSELRKTLCKLAKSEESADRAFLKLLEVVEGYHASRWERNGNGKPTYPTPKNARHQLLALRRMLGGARKKARLALDTAEMRWDLQTKRYLAKANDGPFGQFNRRVEIIAQELDELLTVVTHAQKLAAATMNKPGDLGRFSLAYEVAVIVQTVLELPVTSTKHDGQQHPRGGAAYARVLSATLKLAGFVGFDLDLWQREGIELLEEIPPRV